jgi:hypothetical protein
MKKLLFLALLLLFLIVGILFLGKKVKISPPHSTESHVSIMPTKLSFLSPTEDELSLLFTQIEQQTPQVQWGEKYPDSYVGLTTYHGYSMRGNYLITKLGDEALLSSYLDTTGWTMGDTVFADGPTGHVWGYKRGTTQLIITYKNKSPDQARCPCPWEILVFVTKEK